ncbi:MAG: DegQ family serine endoprotease [Proteobacteria bacterium]|nr:DegQ family serine endoprotease [Pseudomonadota bacterium]MBU1648479.1 DegQ family serine endoprotease [Pseudomonadota bacterium]
MKRKTRLLIAPLPILLLLIFMLGLSWLPANGMAAEDENIQLLDKSAKAFSSVVKKAEPAVVHVRVEKKGEMAHGNQFNPFDDPFFQHFFGPSFRPPATPQQPEQFKTQASGSGFLISEDGYILTNNHVIENADKITVRLQGEQELEGKVIGTDPQSDVALIKISDGRKFPYLPLGDSDQLEVGEWVIAIGSPFGLDSTVTVGVVSAKGRNRMGINEYENFIQTDAAINPGNSGGPLLNIHGEVIGINTAIFSRSGGYMGIGFAIPVNMAKTVKGQLLTKGKVTRSWLGVAIQDMTADLARSFKLKEQAGALVSEVSKDSPAEKGGIKQGDLIISFDGKPVVDVTDLRNRVAMTPPGTRVDLVLIRQGKQQELTVQVAEQPSDMKTLSGAPEQQQLFQKMGMSLQDLTPELARQFGYAKGQGVLIAGVTPGSPAALAGIQAGNLIEEVNRQPVQSLKELQQVLQKSGDTQDVLLLISSGNRSYYVVLGVK